MNPQDERTEPPDVGDDDYPFEGRCVERITERKLPDDVAGLVGEMRAEALNHYANVRQILRAGADALEREHWGRVEAARERLEIQHAIASSRLIDPAEDDGELYSLTAILNWINRQNQRHALAMQMVVNERQRIAQLENQLAATEKRFADEREHAEWLQGECDKAVDAMEEANGKLAQLAAQVDPEGLSAEQICEVLNRVRYRGREARDKRWPKKKRKE